jgi:hypothetical protein
MIRLMVDTIFSNSLLVVIAQLFLEVEDRLVLDLRVDVRRYATLCMCV